MKGPHRISMAKCKAIKRQTIELQEASSSPKSINPPEKFIERMMAMQIQTQQKFNIRQMMREWTDYFGAHVKEPTEQVLLKLQEAVPGLVCA